MEKCYIVTEFWDNAEEDEEEFLDQLYILKVFKTKESAVKYVKAIISAKKEFVRNYYKDTNLAFRIAYRNDGEYYRLGFEYPNHGDPFDNGVYGHEHFCYTVECHDLFD